MVSDSPRYRVGETVIADLDDRVSQQLLAAAHRRHHRPLCQCQSQRRTPPPGRDTTPTPTAPARHPVQTERRPEMYVAKTPRGRYILKRLPGSGPLHHPECDSYEPPGEHSGRGSITLTDDPNGLTRLHLAIPLSQPPVTKPRTDLADLDRPADAPRTSRPRGSAGGASLAALLDYLWEEAGLHRWSPRMAGKRNWAVIRHHLNQVAEATLIDDDRLLEDLLWIPEVYSPSRRQTIETRRQQWWNRLEPTGQERPFAIAIIEWAGIKPARYGQAITAKQVGWPPFMIATEAYRALSSRFPQIDLHAQHPGGHLVMAATFSMSRGGYPVIEDAAFLALDASWLPYATHEAHSLLHAAVTAQRRFTTPLRYDAPLGQKLPALVLTDTPVPVAAYTGNAAPATHTTASEAWTWAPGASLPAPFPRPANS